MKYLILFTIVFSQFSFAANPDQDLIVDLVRERFAASRVAKIEDLKLGKSWKCAIYSGQRGFVPNYNTYKELFHFEKYEDNKIVNKLDFEFSIFEFTDGGLVANSGNTKLYVRATSNGSLVFENVGKQPKRHKAYRSISNDKLRGLDYIYCK